MTNAPHWLITLGVPQNCITVSPVAQENKRRFAIKVKADEQVWRVKVDDCWLSDQDHKKVDFLFWWGNSANDRLVLLVELKGKRFDLALKQIEATLERLCKTAPNQGIHSGSHQASPGHTLVKEGGVKAYVVLSKGKGVRLRSTELERLRKRYKVRIEAKSQQIEVNLP